MLQHSVTMNRRSGKQDLWLDPIPSCGSCYWTDQMSIVQHPI